MYKIKPIKIVLILVCMFFSAASFSQKLSRFQDSLTLKNHRSWFRVDGSRFTKENDNCQYGMEFVFYKANNTAIQYICDKGAWKKTQLTYKLTDEDDNHFLELLDDKNQPVGKIEMQMLRIAGTNRYKTELTFFNRSEKEFYTLVSNEY